MWYLVAASLVALAHSASISDVCTAEAWGAWGPCMPAKCESPVGNSYHLEESSAWDIGRSRMARTMKIKESLRQARAACREAGTCPMMAERPSEGRVNCVGGFANDLSCHNIDQLSFVNFDDLGYTDYLSQGQSRAARAGNDIWGWTDPIFGHEYALVGLTGGTSFVRVTNPEVPVTVGWLPGNGAPSTWRDIKVIGNFAYIVSEARNHGMQIFDLTKLRGLESIQVFGPADITLYTGWGNCHNIVANEATNFVYGVGSTKQALSYPNICSGGLFAVDVSSPNNPLFAGCYGGDGYTHDAQCVVYTGPDTRYTNREICFAYNENSLTIVDVNNKLDMHMISKVAYTGVQYSHQGWLTEDMAVLLLDDELDEYQQPINQQFTKTYMWNIQDLQNPVLERTVQAPLRSIDHNQYTLDGYTYQSNYESGLRVKYIDQALYDLIEVAFFDVLPGASTAEFYGAWSVYPYFASGTLIVDSIDYGLFVLRMTPVAFTEEARRPVNTTSRARLLNTRSSASCPAVETLTCRNPITC